MYLKLIIQKQTEEFTNTTHQVQTMKFKMMEQRLQIL